MAETATAAGQDSTSTTSTSTTASGPEGELADDALGSVSQGTSAAVAEEIFGPADRSEEFEL